jgi:hypothetical protein
MSLIIGFVRKARQKRTSQQRFRLFDFFVTAMDSFSVGLVQLGRTEVALWPVRIENEQLLDVDRRNGLNQPT